MSELNKSAVPRGGHIILCFTMQFFAFDKKPDAFTEVTDSKMFHVEPFISKHFTHNKQKVTLQPDFEMTRRTTKDFSSES